MTCSCSHTIWNSFYFYLFLDSIEAKKPIRILVIILAMDSHVKRLNHINNRLESVANHLQPSNMNSSNDLPILRDYHSILTNSLATFITLSTKIGGDLVPMVEHVQRLFNLQNDFLRQAIQMKKPTNDQQISELIKPQSNEIEAIVGKMIKRTKNLKLTCFFFSLYEQKS